MSSAEDTTKTRHAKGPQSKAARLVMENSDDSPAEGSGSRGSFFEKVCRFCQGILLEWPNPLPSPRGSGRAVHHDNLASLRSAAVDGCFICYSLWARLVRDNDLDDPRLQNLDLVVYELFILPPDTKHIGSLGLTLRLEVMDRGGGLMMTHNDTQYIAAIMKFNIEPTLRDVNTSLWPYLEGAEMTTDRVSLDKAVQWLETCRTSHEQCNAQSNSKSLSWQPTRLLYLEDTSPLPRMRLTLSEDRGNDIEYVTLSHQWGNVDFLKLNMKNLNAMRLTGIPFEDLSHTFQDAASTCLKLGFRYLWIDSLCIIQDSRDDWLREASMMQKAYQNAALTISATGRHIMSEGLGSIRHLNSTIQTARFGRGTDEVQRCLIYDHDFWDTFILRAPLMGRGWVLQERLLSPRILHFAQGQLAWECDILESSELFELGALSCITRSRDSSGLPRVSRREMRPPVETDQDFATFHKRWLWVVQTYSECRLTEQSDKLIALAGIAASLGHYNEDVYDAGLWRSSLIQDLAWHTIDDSESRRLKAHEYRAPSWSWASVEGRVHFSSWCHVEIGRQNLAALVDVTIDLVDSDNPFGAVKGGNLILRGICATAQYCADREITKRDRFFNLEIANWRDYGFDSESTGFNPDDMTDVPEDIYVFALGFLPGQGHAFCGLVLAKVNDGQTDSPVPCYRRVGICNVYVDVGLDRQKMEQAPRDPIMIV